MIWSRWPCSATTKSCSGIPIASPAPAPATRMDQLLIDARRARFDVVLVWASDRLARSVRHFLEVLDELNRLGIEYVSFRENIDTGGPLARAVIVIIGAVAELERNLIVDASGPACAAPAWTGSGSDVRLYTSTGKLCCGMGAAVAACASWRSCTRSPVRRSFAASAAHTVRAQL